MNESCGSTEGFHRAEIGTYASSKRQTTRDRKELLESKLHDLTMSRETRQSMGVMGRKMAGELSATKLPTTPRQLSPELRAPYAAIDHRIVPSCPKRRVQTKRRKGAKGQNKESHAKGLLTIASKSQNKESQELNEQVGAKNGTCSPQFSCDLSCIVLPGLQERAAPVGWK
jgi:hypothetical protein